MIVWWGNVWGVCGCSKAYKSSYRTAATVWEVVQGRELLCNNTSSCDMCPSICPKTDRCTSSCSFSLLYATFFWSCLKTGPWECQKCDRINTSAASQDSKLSDRRCQVFLLWLIMVVWSPVTMRLRKVSSFLYSYYQHKWLQMSKWLSICCSLQYLEIHLAQTFWKWNLWLTMW